MFEELLYLEKKFSNIKLAKKRFNSIWGGSSLLTTILSCFADIFTFWNDWNFVINLSETDFPIRYFLFNLIVFLIIIVLF